MRWFAIPLFSLALVSCSGDLSEEEQAEQDAALADMVREANDNGPPLQEIVPEVIGYPDMEANDLIGLSCAYAPGTSMGVRVIARENDAYMKIDGEMVRFAADPGSRELPANTRTLYNGNEFVLRVALEGEGDESEGEGEVRDPEGTNYEATMWLYDRWDRVVYTGTGTASCGT